MRVYIQYDRKMDVTSWAESYQAGTVPDEMPYGLHHLRECGWEPSFRHARSSTILTRAMKPVESRLGLDVAALVEEKRKRRLPTSRRSLLVERRRRLPYGVGSARSRTSECHRLHLGNRPGNAIPNGEGHPTFVASLRGSSAAVVRTAASDLRNGGRTRSRSRRVDGRRFRSLCSSSRRPDSKYGDVRRQRPAPGLGNSCPCYEDRPVARKGCLAYRAFAASP